MQGEAVGSGTESLESVLTRDNLGMLQRFYFIPTGFEIKPADFEERVNFSPMRYLGLYEKALKASLQFSF